MKFKSKRNIGNLKGRYALSVKERIKRDYIFANNPVLVAGLGIAPVIVAATSLRNSLTISLIMSMIIIVIRIFGNFTVGFLSKELRFPLYALASSLMFIPAYLAVELILPHDVARLERFLPLIVLDSIIISAAQLEKREKFNESVRSGIFISLGFSFAVCLIGVIRELFGESRIFGIYLTGFPVLFPILKTTVGGFMTLALIAGVFQVFVSALKRSAYREERET